MICYFDEFNKCLLYKFISINIKYVLGILIEELKFYKIYKILGKYIIIKGVKENCN